MQCKVGIHESPYDVLLDELNPAIGEGEAPKVGAIPAGFDGSVGDKLADIFVQTNPDYNQRKTVIALGGVIEEEPKMDWMTFCHVTWVLLQRIFIVKMRDPIAAMTQVSSAIIMGLIYGGLYSNVYDKSTISFSILDTQMCIVMVVMMCVWLPYDVCLTFPLERKIFLRERKAGLYPTLAFYLARITADVPAHIFSAFIMSVIVWGLAGLKIGLGNFILIMIFGILIGASMMQTIGAISRTFEEANIYMMVILMMSMMLGTGFVREVPSWLGWARSISVMGLTADLAMYLEFKDVDPKYGTAAEIFAQYGVRITNDTQMWEGVLTLLQILIVCRILCFIAVKFMFTGRTFEEDLAD